jgi:hypothetical protein
LPQENSMMQIMAIAIETVLPAENIVFVAMINNTL